MSQWHRLRCSETRSPLQPTRSGQHLYTRDTAFEQFRREWCLASSKCRLTPRPATFQPRLLPPVDQVGGESTPVTHSPQRGASSISAWAGRTWRVNGTPLRGPVIKPSPDNRPSTAADVWRRRGISHRADGKSAARTDGRRRGYARLRAAGDARRMAGAARKTTDDEAAEATTVQTRLPVRIQMPNST